MVFLILALSDKPQLDQFVDLLCNVLIVSSHQLARSKDTQR